MPGRECYHCKQLVQDGELHDCWTTTEAALLKDTSDELREAYERVRETAEAFGEQRIYASHNSIMFSRKSCYFFVRPKKSFLEVCIFLGRPVHAPQVRRVENSSKAKVVNIVHIRHRDEVEAPMTDWIREAYELPDRLAATAAGGRSQSAKPKAKAAAAKRKAKTGVTKKKAGAAKKPGARKSSA